MKMNAGALVHAGRGRKSSSRARAGADREHEPAVRSAQSNRRASARAPATKPRATAKDAIAFLRAHHVEARSLLKMLSESSERAVQKRERALARAASALWVQMQIEEEIFYAAFEGALSTPDDEVRAYEARAEHESAKAALRRLEGCAPDTTQFRAMAKVVHDLVDHHAREDEEETFPRVRKLFSPSELVVLGGRLAARKSELLVRRAPIDLHLYA